MLERVRREAGATTSRAKSSSANKLSATYQKYTEGEWNMSNSVVMTNGWLFVVCHAGCCDDVTAWQLVTMTHLRWSWITAGPRLVDRNPPESKPPSPLGEAASGVRPPSLPQKLEAIDSPRGVAEPAGEDIERGVLLDMNLTQQYRCSLASWSWQMSQVWPRTHLRSSSWLEVSCASLSDLGVGGEPSIMRRCFSASSLLNSWLGVARWSWNGEIVRITALRYLIQCWLTFSFRVWPLLTLWIIMYPQSLIVLQCAVQGPYGGPLGSG